MAAEPKSPAMLFQGAGFATCPGGLGHDPGRLDVVNCAKQTQFLADEYEH